MPDRILRPGILTSDAVCSLSWAEEVFYRRLHSIIDDFGRYSADPRLLRAAAYPLQMDKVSNSDIASWIASCVKAGLVRSYSSNGKWFVEVTKFNQRLRAKKSKCPDPPPVELGEQMADICGQMPADVRTMRSNATESDTESDTKKEKLKKKNFSISKWGPSPQALPIPIPEDLMPDEKAILEWLAYKREKGQTYKPLGLEALWDLLRKIPNEKRSISIRHSMGLNYSGIFEKKVDSTTENWNDKSNRKLAEANENIMAGRSPCCRVKIEVFEAYNGMLGAQCLKCKKTIDGISDTQKREIKAQESPPVADIVNIVGLKGVA